MIDDIYLDHVTLAYERRRHTWARYGGDLPGVYLGGGAANGFANYQLEYANGMKLEVLEPALVEENDFLVRYLERNGSGPHHLTYKVQDINVAIAQVEDAGYHPVGVSVMFPGWKEMFLHPKEAPGIVIQIAQSDGDDWVAPPPQGFPAPRTPTAASLDRVVHAVSDLAEGLKLFHDLLSGVATDEGDDWIDLTWPHGGCVRLVTGPNVTSWLSGRSGRLHHLRFSTTDPGGIADAVRVAESDVWEIEPEHNFGTRLQLHAMQS